MEFNINDPYYDMKMNAVTALYNVIDPELFINIIDLGLVYDLDFTDNKKIKVTMTLSTKHCPLGDAIKQGVTNVLGMAFPERETEIGIVWEPEWNFDMLTPEGRRDLGIE
ncbi:MAG TPA: metal-sulfur cluster assembly factor [Edaphocola sp.]|nr:metal-sulfur cluster assembly factor [Edaphocola sp.]